MASDVITILSSKMMSRLIHLKDDCCWCIKEWQLSVSLSHLKMIFKYLWAYILYLLLSSLQDSKLEALYFIQNSAKGFLDIGEQAVGKATGYIFRQWGALCSWFSWSLETRLADKKLLIKIGVTVICLARQWQCSWYMYLMNFSLDKLVKV